MALAMPLAGALAAFKPATFDFEGQRTNFFVYSRSRFKMD